MSNKGSVFHKVIVPLLFVAVLLSVSGCQNLLSTGPPDLVKAIPNNAAFIIKISDPIAFDGRLSSRTYQTVIREKVLPGELAANHEALKTLLKEGQFLEAGRNVALLASLHLASADQLNSIHYFPLSISNKAYLRQLTEHFPGAASQQWNYEGVEFNEVILPDLNVKITAAYSNGILIASPVSFLVEDAVKQLKSGKTLSSEPGFKRVYNEQTDEADANIWMPFANSKHWMSLFASDDGLDLIGDFSKIGSWMLMDVYLNEEEIFMSGITSVVPGNSLNRLKSKAACNHILDDYIPFNTAAYQHFAHMTDSIADKLAPYGLGGCWSKILLEPLNTAIDEHVLYLLPVKDDEKFKATGKVDGTLSMVLSRMLFHGKSCYYQKTAEFIAVSSNQQALENYLSNIKGNQVLTRDETFLALKEDLKSDAQLTCYARTMYHRETFNAVYSSSSEAQEAYQAFKGFNQVALQFSLQGDAFLTNATLTYNEDDGGSHTNLAWGIELGAPVLAGPQVIELDSDGAMGVLVQDTDFNLYLLDKAGEMLWKKELESRWMGSVYSLRLYEDAGNTITFNTETNWYLMDSEGNDVAGYPLHLKDRASAPLSLLEVKDDKFVFIASRNGNLYGYELSGKPMHGWNPKEKTGIIRHAPQFVKEGDDFYVSAINEKGVAYIWDSKGKSKGRNGFKTSFPSDHFQDVKASPFKVKNVKSNGELISMNAIGKVGRYQLPVSSINQYAMANVHGNDDPEIILSNGSSIWLFDYTGQRIWKKAFRGNIRVVDLPGSARRAIAVRNEKEKTFTVLNPDGSTLVEGNIQTGSHSLFTAKDLLGSGQPALITSGLENELYCYRIAL